MTEDEELYHAFALLVPFIRNFYTRQGRDWGAVPAGEAWEKCCELAGAAAQQHGTLMDTLQFREIYNGADHRSLGAVMFMKAWLLIG